MANKKTETGLWAVARCSYSETISRISFDCFRLADSNFLLQCRNQRTTYWFVVRPSVEMQDVESINASTRSHAYMPYICHFHLTNKALMDSRKKVFSNVHNFSHCTKLQNEHLSCRYIWWRKFYPLSCSLLHVLHSASIAMTAISPRIVNI